MTVRINDVKCPACGGKLEIVKGIKPHIHCTECERDWETGLIPLRGEMQIPDKFDMRKVIDTCKESHEKLGYMKEDSKFMGFRLYFDLDGMVICNGFFLAGFDPDPDDP